MRKIREGAPLHAGEVDAPPPDEGGAAGKIGMSDARGDMQATQKIRGIQDEPLLKLRMVFSSVSRVTGLVR